MMKVIAINGSPNREGNAFHALNMVGEELVAAGKEATAGSIEPPKMERKEMMNFIR